MPIFETETPEVIQARVLAAIGTDLQTREGSYTYDVTAPLAFEIWRVLMTLDELVSAFYVDEYSGPYLDQHAALLALARKEGTTAYAVIHFTGQDGVIVPAGTIFLTDAGEQFSLVYDVTIEDGAAEGYLKAAEVGEQYNVDAGEITQIVRTISGLTSWTNDAATGGTDPEDDATLFERIKYRREHPSTSGNENHYVEWALECDGVGAAKATGLWAGAGTVRVLLVDYDSQPVDQAVVDAVEAYIQTQRPVGADVTVLSASGTGINVTASITLAAGASLASVQAAFVSELDTYLRKLSFESYTVYYNQIAALLMGVEGVVDFAALLVNGGTDNIALDETAVPVIGEVVLT